MSKVIHGSQVLLEEAEKAFSVGNQERGISFVKDCVEMLTNYLKNLPAEQPAEQPAEEKGITTEAGDKAESREASMVEVENAIESESKPGSGEISGPSDSESKPGSGAISNPEKSQNRDGSGVS